MLGLTTAQLVYLNIQENSVRLEAKDLKAHSVYPKELTSLFPTTIRRTNRESPGYWSLERLPITFSLMSVLAATRVHASCSLWMPTKL